MKRLIGYYLSSWKKSSDRRPLLLRGARQVGKTFSIREFGKRYDSFVEINFDLQPKAGKIFDADLEPSRIIRDLSIFTNQPIVPGKTLLFLDEIQKAPQAISALRYFYEKMPEMHVVAAGSLLEFALDKVGIPVGRVTTMYMYPVCFVEFLAAKNHALLFDELMAANPHTPLAPVVHEQLLSYISEYLAVGGMPASMHRWLTMQSMAQCAEVHADLLETFRQDFQHYAKKHQQPYAEALFNEIPLFAGRKFKFSAISGSYRKRELHPALDLLIKAGVVHKVVHSPGHGIPLGANADLEAFKTIFLDCSLAQTALGMKIGDWVIDSQASFVNKGAITESFVGQELLAIMPPHAKYQLYYWLRESRSSNAEVDYLIQKGPDIIPVEVKSGAAGSLKSLHIFLREHPESPYGIRFSADNFSLYEKIHSYPLYAVWRAADTDKTAIEWLMNAAQ